jgi:HlyD family secretion protein
MVHARLTARSLRWRLAAAGTVLAGAAWWTLGHSAPPPPTAPAWRVERVEEREFHRVVVATGLLRPSRTTVVGAQVSGTVIQVGADFNDRVAKGQVLVRLDPVGFRARVEQADAQQRSSEVALAVARDIDGRNQRLSMEGFLSAAALDQGRRNVELAEAGLRLAQAQVRLAQVDLANSVVRSPIDGVVISRNVEPGQTLTSAFQVPDLFVIAQDLSTLKLVANVPEADAAVVPRAGDVEFRVDAWPGQSFRGRIVAFRLSDTATQGLVTFPLVARVDNRDGRLRPGLTTEVRIEADDRRRALSVSLAALRHRPAALAASAAADEHDADGTTVFVRTADGRTEARRVVLGAIEAGHAEVLRGPLHAGDHVIVGEADGPD